MSKSILTEYMDYCVICGKPRTDVHHLIEGTSGRRLSDEDGLICPLCASHHNMHRYSVHDCREMNVMSHIIGELAWERQRLADEVSKNDDRTTDEVIEQVKTSFRKRYGKCYL